MIVSAHYKEIIEITEQMKEIKIKNFNNFQVFFDSILKDRFFKALEIDPNIQFNLNELYRIEDILFRSLNINYSRQIDLDKTKDDPNRVKNRLKLNLSNVLNNSVSFYYDYVRKVVEIWKKTNELLGQFMQNYMELLSLLEKKKIKELSLKIRQIVADKNQIMYDVGKIDSLQYISEKNELLFTKAQYQKINQDIENLLNKSKNLGFDLQEPFFFILDNFLKDYESMIDGFTKKLLLGKITEDGILLINMQNLDECVAHAKNFHSPIDFSFEYGSNLTDVRDFEKPTLQLNVPINLILQDAFSLMFNRKPQIMRELKINGLFNLKNQKNMIFKIKDDMKVFDNLYDIYMEGLAKELQKFEIGHTTDINLLQFIDRNILNVISNRIDTYIQFSNKNMEIYLGSLSVLIVLKLMEHIIDFKDDIEIENKDFEKNPFKK